jgi:hypothetical protein
MADIKTKETLCYLCKNLPKNKSINLQIYNNLINWKRRNSIPILSLEGISLDIKIGALTWIRYRKCRIATQEGILHRIEVPESIS